MTQKRFFARWTDRQDGQDLYDVLDSETMTRTLERQPYHVANDHARKLNDEPEAQGEWVLAATAWTAPVPVLLPHDVAKLALLEKLTDEAMSALAQAEIHGEAEFSGVKIKALNDLGEHAYLWTWTKPK